MGGTFNKRQKQIIVERDEARCIYCGQPATGIDHVIPVFEDGPTITANGVCCCHKCNAMKHTSLDEKWIVKGLARLIQHGEDISWVGNLRPEVVELEPLPHAISVLYEHDFTIVEIATVLDLACERVLEILDASDSMYISNTLSELQTSASSDSMSHA